MVSSSSFSPATPGLLLRPLRGPPLSWQELDIGGLCDNSAMSNNKSTSYLCRHSYRSKRRRIHALIWSPLKWIMGVLSSQRVRFWALFQEIAKHSPFYTTLNTVKETFRTGICFIICVLSFQNINSYFSSNEFVPIKHYFLCFRANYCKYVIMTQFSNFLVLFWMSELLLVQIFCF